MNKQKFDSFSEFYPFYLSQHENPICRSLHLIGFIFALISFVIVLATSEWMYLPIAPVSAYGLAWIGHFFFEKNKPATLTYPIFSFRGDLTLVKDMLMGHI